jgi:diguanylate cyclase (GGDEF)-like protein
MPAALSRRLLLVAAFSSSGLIFGAFLLYERPGLGIGHFYYLSIALAALAGGAAIGATAGLIATGLYVAGVLINPHVPSHELLTTGTITRGFTYVTIGALMGWFASRNRAMVDELRVLAERDVLTGLPNTRAFESAITRRLASGRPFALLVADMDALKDFNRDEGFTAGNDALRRLADRLATSLGPDDDIARVGSDEFAILAAVPRSSPAISSGCSRTIGRRRRSAGHPSPRRETTRSRSIALRASASTHARSCAATSDRSPTRSIRPLRRPEKPR